MEIRARETSRRRFLANAGAVAGAAGTAVLAVNWTHVLAAAAQEAAEGPDEAAVAAFVEGVELGLVEAYRLAAATGLLSPAVVATGNGFAAHHAQHAAAYANAAGGAAKGKANARLVTLVTDQLANARDEMRVAQILHDLEEASASTYLWAIGTVTSTSAVQLAASILPVESQHAVVFGQVLGETLEHYVPDFENQDKALDITKYSPATSTTTTTEQ